MQTADSGNGPAGQSLLKSIDPHVHEVIKTAHQELQNLMGQRATIMRRIVTLKQTICGLADLFGDDIVDKSLMKLLDRKVAGRQRGFTKICRLVLMESGSPLSVREVCDRIKQREPDMLQRHKDPLVSVSTVLNRLAEYGEAQRIVRPNGQRAWQWISNPPAVTEQDTHVIQISGL